MRERVQSLYMGASGLRARASYFTAPFSPDDISGLQIWLKADAITGLSDNDPVATWEDSSSANHDFTEATNRPVYKTNIVNGKPVVRFDGTNDKLSGGDLSGSFPSAATSFIVFSEANANKYTIYTTKNNDTHYSFVAPTDGYYGVFRSTRINNYPSSVPQTDNVFRMWTTLSSSSTYEVWIDQVSQGSQTAGFDGGNDHEIGYQDGQGYYTACDVAELICYDSALNSTQRGQVETYLKNKYNI